MNQRIDDSRVSRCRHHCVSSCLEELGEANKKLHRDNDHAVDELEGYTRVEQSVKCAALEGPAI